MLLTDSEQIQIQYITTGIFQFKNISLEGIWAFFQGFAFSPFQELVHKEIGRTIDDLEQDSKSSDRLPQMIFV